MSETINTQSHSSQNADFLKNTASQIDRVTKKGADDAAKLTGTVADKTQAFADFMTPYFKGGATIGDALSKMGAMGALIDKGNKLGLKRLQYVGEALKIASQQGKALTDGGANVVKAVDNEVKGVSKMARQNTVKPPPKEELSDEEMDARNPKGNGGRRHMSNSNPNSKGKGKKKKTFKRR